MSTVRPASFEHAHVSEFCRSAIPGGSASVVPHVPVAGKEEKECFVIVPEHVVSHGGKQQLGWAIWETPGLFIEAEFHAVWQSPEGELINLTPLPIAVDHILFVADHGREYTGRQVDNIRQALVKDFYVSQFLRLAQRRFEILNEGDLANQHGAIELPPAALREYRDLQKEMAKLQARFSRRAQG